MAVTGLVGAGRRRSSTELSRSGGEIRISADGEANGGGDGVNVGVGLGDGLVVGSMGARAAGAAAGWGAGGWYLRVIAVSRTDESKTIMKVNRRPVKASRLNVKGRWIAGTT